MRNARITLFLLILALSVLVPVAVFGSDISGSLYSATIAVTNNDTAETNVATVASINTTNLIDGGYLNAGANNSVITNTSGADVPFMPGYTPDGNPWVLWVPSIGANSILSYILYTANSSGGDINYFPGVGGMATADNETLEVGDNFTLEVDGFFNTDLGSDRDVLHFTRGANSNIETGAIYNNQAKMWTSFWFKLDSDFSAASPADMWLFHKFVNATNYWSTVFRAATGQLQFEHNHAGTLETLIAELDGAVMTEWNADQWYHVIASISSAEGHRLRINANPTVVADPDVSAAPNGGNLFIGDSDPASVANRGITGLISDFAIGIDDLSNAEELGLYDGTLAGDETDFWAIDEGAGTNIASTGSQANAGTSKANNVWQTYRDPLDKTHIFYKEGAFFVLANSGNITAWIQGGVSASAMGEPDADAKLTVGANITHLFINVDDVSKASVALGGVGVPDADSDVFSIRNGVMSYMTSYNITIDGVAAQLIEWEYSDNFTDRSVNNNYAIPTFREASSDPDVSANMSSFQPVAEAQAPSFTLTAAPPFIDPEMGGNVTGSFNTTPPLPAGTFPLAGVIVAVAEATSSPTPSQLPLLTIAITVILGFSLMFSYFTRKYGSGTILIKIMIIAGVMGIFNAMGNFGIDFWLIPLFVMFTSAFAIASMQGSWN